MLWAHGSHCVWKHDGAQRRGSCHTQTKICWRRRAWAFCPSRSHILSCFWFVYMSVVCAALILLSDLLVQMAASHRVRFNPTKPAKCEHTLRDPAIAGHTPTQRGTYTVPIFDLFGSLGTVIEGQRKRKRGEKSRSLVSPCGWSESMQFGSVLHLIYTNRGWSRILDIESTG